jgi:hypothetical protein
VGKIDYLAAVNALTAALECIHNVKLHLVRNSRVVTADESSTEVF